MRYLLLLNRRFPFRTGETFLENEIGELARAFDRILIFPSDVSAGETATRPLPSERVSVYAWEKGSLRKRQMGYGVRGIKRMGGSGAARLTERLAEGYFLEAASCQAEGICRYLDQIPFQREDRVFVYSYWLYINAKAAVLTARYLREKGVWAAAFSRGHRFDIYEERRRLNYLPQRKELLEELAAVYPCSEDGASYLRRRFPGYAEKIFAFRLGTADHGIGKASGDGVFRLVSCSRLVPVKRVGLILEALALLAGEGIAVSWTHLGGGKQLERLKRKARRRCPDMETAFPGAVPNEAVCRFYGSNPVDLFVNVSRSEGLPVSIMEAISFGIPVLATDVGGSGEIVLDGVNGRLLPAELSARLLSEEILRMARLAPEESQQMRKMSREIWETRFNAKTNYRLFTEELGRLEENVSRSGNAARREGHRGV